MERKFQTLIDFYCYVATDFIAIKRLADARKLCGLILLDVDHVNGIKMWVCPIESH